ncbi:MFS transporter [Pseudomonas nitroreducens]|uniref:MFS transporter n=1 Tax=Pseudomonas TaxID=286 RepID=UPI00056A7B43|nr:MFS transporter [Pseudomonas nitroreducens]
MTHPPSKSAAGFSPRASAWLLTAILMTFLAAAAAPTPLYALYRESWQFSPALLTLVFSIYAGGLMLALLVLGSLSDYLGRRPLIRAALIIELLAMSVFLYASSVELLIAARLLQGFATGIATAVLGAAMLDIDRERGPLINSVAPMLGMALGALGSSALVQFGSDPLHRVYVWLLVVFALALMLLRWLPESVSPQPGAWASLKPRIRVPPQARRTFWSVAPLNAALWALGGFYLSLGPTLARQVTGLQVPMIGGGLVSLLCFCGAVAIFALRNQPAPAILRRGGLALIVGLLVTLLGVDSANLWLFFLGTAVAGLGFGGAFLGALRSVVPLAHAHERGALMASFYVLSYLAFSVPAILAGLAIQRYGLVATTNGYASLQILAASLVLLLSLRATGVRKVRA